MNKSFILLFYFLYCLLIINGNSYNNNPSDEEGEVLFPEVELFFMTEGLPNEPIMSLTLQNESQCYALDTIRPTGPIEGDFYSTNEFNYATYSPPGNNLGDSYSAGFDFITSPHTIGGGYGYPVFTYGLYKVTNNINGKYFYIDYRDNRAGFYVMYDPPFDGNETDLRIFYDGNSNQFAYWDFSLPLYYENISVGDVLRIWEIKGKGIPQTNLFPNYWSNVLAVVNNGNGNPKLVWGPHPTMDATNYKIYRAISISPLSNPVLMANEIATVDGSTFEYTDYGLKLNLNGDFIYYFIKAYNGSYSNNSNIVEVTAYLYKKNSEKNEGEFSFKLNQNYPNPFNPITNIQYSIPRQSYVNLKIYNILGQEIASLVSEELSAGVHNVTFDGSNLPSGIYFYTLNTDNYSETKKLMLIK